jgi:hypothetical protein
LLHKKAASIGYANVVIGYPDLAILGQLLDLEKKFLEVSVIFSWILICPNLSFL